MKMTMQETALISKLRKLSFDDVLDAMEGISIKASDASMAALRSKEMGNLTIAENFRLRVKALEQFAKLLGDANAVYRSSHLPHDENAMPFAPYMPGVSKMQDSSAGEIIHLFETMQKYGSKCSLEFQSAGIADPLIGVPYLPVRLIEYCEHSGGPDALILELGELSFHFELGVNQFTKNITDCQITVCIFNDNYCAWFNSDAIPPKGIEEAVNCNAIDPDDRDQEIHLNASADDFESELADLKNLIDMGQVIKGVVVVGEGNQIVTVGWFREPIHSNES
jgi:hypothetical protein